MRTRHIRAAFLAALAAFPLLFGCEGDVTDEKRDDSPREFTATIGVDTKTLLGVEYDSSGDQKRQLLWALNDEVVVGGSVYKATGLSTDERTAVLTGSGALKDDGTVYKAYYPKGLYSKSGNTVTLTLPGKPGYAGLAGGRVIASNLPMYAQSENTQLRFHNLCAVLNFRLTGTDKVEKIVIKSKTRRLWGTFEIDGSETAGWYAKVPSGGTPTDEEKCVTLLCDKAQLDVTDPTEFCIALPEYTYPQGDLSVEVWSETEIIATLNNDGAGSSGSELKRNTIYNIEKVTKLTVSELELDKSSDTKWVGDDNGAAITVSTKTVTYSTGSKVNNPAADSWTNSNTAAVTMTIAADKKSVTLLPKAAGTAVITAKIGDQTATYTLMVNQMNSVTISPNSTATVYITEQRTFTPKYSWTRYDGQPQTTKPDGWSQAWTPTATTGVISVAASGNNGVMTARKVSNANNTVKLTLSRTNNSAPKSGTYNVKVADLTATVTANPTTIAVGGTPTTGTAVLKKGSQTLAPKYTWTLSSGLSGSSSTNTIKATGTAVGSRTLTCTMTYTANGVTVTKKPSATVTVRQITEATITDRDGGSWPKIMYYPGNNQTLHGTFKINANPIIKDTQGNIISDATVSWICNGSKIRNLVNHGIQGGYLSMSFDTVPSSPQGLAWFEVTVKWRGVTVKKEFRITLMRQQ